MRTTLDLPDALMRQIKIRAASEGRKLKEVMTELLEKSLEAAPSPTVAEGTVPYTINPENGTPVIRSLGTPGFALPTLEEFFAIIEKANDEESLSRAGLPR